MAASGDRPAGMLMVQPGAALGGLRGAERKLLAGLKPKRLRRRFARLDPRLADEARADVDKNGSE